MALHNPATLAFSWALHFQIARGTYGFLIIYDIWIFHAADASQGFLFYRTPVEVC